MYKILKAEKLAEKIFLMDVEAPEVYDWLGVEEYRRTFVMVDIDDDFSNTYIIKAKFDAKDTKSVYAFYILTKDDFSVDSISSSSILVVDSTMSPSHTSPSNINIYIDFFLVFGANLYLFMISPLSNNHF